MSANINPLYPITPNTTVAKTIATANTAVDGSGSMVTVYTAGSNGGKPESIMFRALGTNVATVARVFIADATGGSGHASLFGEITLPATTISLVAAQSDMRYQFPDNFRLPNGYQIQLTIGTTVAAGYGVTCYGADY